jgi:hypothetical protein
LSSDDAQQFSREARQRLDEAQALREQLSRQGVDVKELDQAIEGLRGMTNSGSLEDPQRAAELRSKTIEGLKNFEFGLRRSLGESEANRVLLERSGDVPPAYKQNVEEYYRSIGRGKPDGKPENKPDKPKP